VPNYIGTVHRGITGLGDDGALNMHPIVSYSVLLVTGMKCCLGNYHMDIM